MNFIEKTMKMAQDFNILEIAFIKIYILVVSFLLAIWFPILLSADLLVYIILFIVFYISILIIFIKKEGNFYKTIFTEGIKSRIFSKMNMFDMSVFKTTIFITGLLLAKLFPVLLTVHIAWYVGIAGLFIGYFFGGVFCRR